jgi:hypothetical protein
MASAVISCSTVGMGAVLALVGAMWALTLWRCLTINARSASPITALQTLCRDVTMVGSGLCDAVPANRQAFQVWQRLPPSLKQIETRPHGESRK